MIGDISLFVANIPPMRAWKIQRGVVFRENGCVPGYFSCKGKVITLRAGDLRLPAGSSTDRC